MRVYAVPSGKQRSTGIGYIQDVHLRSMWKCHSGYRDHDFMRPPAHSLVLKASGDTRDHADIASSGIPHIAFSDNLRSCRHRSTETQAQRTCCISFFNATEAHQGSGPTTAQKDQHRQRRTLQQLCLFITIRTRARVITPKTQLFPRPRDTAAEPAIRKSSSMGLALKDGLSSAAGTTARAARTPESGPDCAHA